MRDKSATAVLNANVSIAVA